MEVLPRLLLLRRSKFQLCWQRVYQATDWEGLAGQLAVADTMGAWEHALQLTPLYQVRPARWLPWAMLLLLLLLLPSCGA